MWLKIGLHFSCLSWIGQWHLNTVSIVIKKPLMSTMTVMFADWCCNGRWTVWHGVRCEGMSNQASTAESEVDRLNMLEQCASLFARLQGDFYEEYHVYELSTLAVAVVYPLVSHCQLIICYTSICNSEPNWTGQTIQLCWTFMLNISVWCIVSCIILWQDENVKS